MGHGGIIWAEANWEKERRCTLRFHSYYHLQGNMLRMHKRASLLLGGLVGLSSCMTAPPTVPIECPAEAKVASMKTTVPLTIISDHRLSACERDRSCDRVHFIQGLFTLSENPQPLRFIFGKSSVWLPRARLDSSVVPGSPCSGRRLQPMTIRSRMRRPTG